MNLNSPSFDISLPTKRRTISDHWNADHALSDSPADNQHGARQIAGRIEAKGVLIFVFGIIRPGYDFVACRLALFVRSLEALLPPRSKSRTIDLDGTDPTHRVSLGISGTTRQSQYCYYCLLYTSPSPRDRQKSRMPSSA